VTKIYKILPQTEWAGALANGQFAGSGIDLSDGFIHFSTAAQAAETARRHFAGQTGLVVLRVASERLGAALRWEPSRGGELFPHLYGPLACALVEAATAAPLGPDGVPALGDLPA
jgi:uncharacterized protein (DUF952 family)